MSEQVRRYKLGKNFYSAIVAGDREFVLGTDYDALHAEAEALRLQNAMLVTAASNINNDREALRAENGRLREERDSFQRVGIRAMAEQGERQEAVTGSE